MLPRDLRSPGRGDRELRRPGTFPTEAGLPPACRPGVFGTMGLLLALPVVLLCIALCGLVDALGLRNRTRAPVAVEGNRKETDMELQFNTSNQVDATEEMEARAREIVDGALSRFAARLTRVELHLGDENSPAKGGSADIRCSMEARPQGLRPIAASHNDADPDAAMRGAAKKLARALDNEFGKLDARR